MRTRLRRAIGLPTTWVRTGYGQPSIWLSVPLYLRAVFTRWTVIVGFVAGLVGYVADIVADLKIPPVAWVALFAIGFIVANFQLFHQQRPLTPDESLGLPQWASGALNSRGGGAHLTVILYGFPAARPWSSQLVPRLVDAVSEQFGMKNEDLKVRSYQGGLQVSYPANAILDGPLFDAMFGIEHSGAIRIKWRRAATLTLGWILIHFDDGIRFALSEVSGLVVNRSKRRHIILSLSDWPAAGIDVSGLINASRQPDVFVGGGQDRREYAVTPQTDSWLIAKDFASGLLEASGYVGFEGSMSKLSREDCLAYREKA